MAPSLHSAIIATIVLLMVAQCSNAVLTEAEVFWRTILPDYPLPEAILNLLHPENSIANTKHSSPARSSHDGDHSDHHLAQGLFFHEEAVQVSKTISIYFPSSAAAAPPLGLLPRRVADSIPFSTSSLPSVLPQLGIARHSAQAASMAETLHMCEQPPVAGEKARFCATSLEALVEGSMAALGTRDIRPLTSDLPGSGVARQPYTVRSVRPVDGSSFMSCHTPDYPYTVYVCHDTGSTRAYMVEMEGARSGLIVTVAAICHTDTSHWNPKHVSFRVLRTKPGGAPICHYLPYGHIVWANMEANRRSSS